MLNEFKLKLKTKQGVQKASTLVVASAIVVSSAVLVDGATLVDVEGWKRQFRVPDWQESQSYIAPHSDENK